MIAIFDMGGSCGVIEEKMGRAVAVRAAVFSC
jgi:hypothetical protein